MSSGQFWLILGTIYLVGFTGADRKNIGTRVVFMGASLVAIAFYWFDVPFG